MREEPEVVPVDNGAHYVGQHGAPVTPLPTPNTLVLREMLEMRTAIAELRTDLAALAPSDNGWRVMLAAFQALGYALSARALLLLALIGSFVLALIAHDILSSLVLGVFAVTTVPPLTWLEVRKSLTRSDPPGG